ncbi:MAG: OmpA family protein [Deferribacteraceae bacterium]|nr:OmpA family protein [Deferribacteraceae bacterium]
MIIALFVAVLSIGGVEASFALEDRYMYEVVAVNNASKITTVFQVMAVNERDARENVAANGWSVLSIKQATFKIVTALPLIHEPTGDEITAHLSDPNAGKGPDNLTNPLRMTDDELINSLLGAPNAADLNDNLNSSGLPTAQIAAGDGSGDPLQGDNDNLMLLPDSDRLQIIYVVYFNFGIITPTLSEADMNKLRALPQASYYVFGHTDNVSVSANAEYKDNYDLSFKRAEAVKGIMTSFGINPATIKTVGLGATYPAIKNNVGAPGTSENRRVEIYGLRR